ncbi:hypothetical protein M6G63_26025 (plasmid) [Pseudomonas sp. BYT-5]|uniref:hypothetical protein n=1 Tax=unclassified Pseudomonas TaxID=196821 RepID=UPI00202124DC|nr:MULTISPECIES: hypothetical protein [unclassified Pseudomonas]URD45475.1 hypothetical protein M6G63_26025 [Pseudomonas sp. BYT-5]URL00699.1 hypothetical protein J5X93_27240 [Pseudomonas sp. BYT-1]
MQQYYRIPYRNTKYPPISLWELRSIKAYMKARRISIEDEEQIFKAWNEMRRIEDEARSKTRKQRLNQERSRRHRKVTPAVIPRVEQQALAGPEAKVKVSNAVEDVVDEFAHLTPYDER